MSDRPALQRARKLAAEHGLRMVPHGRQAWRIVGYCVDLLVADAAIATLAAKDLAPQLTEIQPGEIPPWAHGVRAWDRR